jgi:hypothetical protein
LPLTPQARERGVAVTPSAAARFGCRASAPSALRILLLGVLIGHRVGYDHVLNMIPNGDLGKGFGLRASLELDKRPEGQRSEVVAKCPSEKKLNRMNRM